MRRSVTVSIAGQKYQLRSDGDDRTVQKLAGELDRRIKDIQKSGKAYDSQRVAMLAALQLTEELHQEREAAVALKRRIRDRSRALLRLLDRGA